MSSEQELAARLDEDEAAAVAAACADGKYGGRPHWSADGGIVTDTGDPDWAVVDLSPCIEDARLGAHIARHDPSRVLRFVAAVREIIRESSGEDHPRFAYEPAYYAGLGFAVTALAGIYEED